MSETDDTDALLTCDPRGGIDDLLGKTLDEISSRALLDSSGSTDKSVKNGVEKTPRNKGRGKNKNKNKKKNGNKSVDTSLDVSDYFNSDGELVLSGLSQFSETTAEGDALDRSAGEGKGNSSGENADYSSDQSSTTTADSNTVVPSSSRALVTIKESNNGTSDDNQKIRNDEKNVEESNTQNSLVAKVDSSETVPKEIQNELKRQLFQANSSNPEAQSILEDNSSHISYGVLNLNLNDLKTFAEGLSICNFFPPSPSPKVNTYVPTRNEKGEQIFVRAPNFRTPGGYKPSKNTRKCRNLTDEQIQEEVRKMYAFPDVDEDSEAGKSGSKTSESEHSNLESKDTSGEKLKVDFNFLEGTPVPNEFGKGKSGKPIKRKLLPNGGNISGGTVGSIPDLGFGLRSLSSDEAKEPIVEKSVAWTTGNANVSKEGESATDHTNERTSGGFTFGFGDGDTYSPIKPPNHSRTQPSPEKPKNVAGTDKVAHEEGTAEKKSLQVGSTEACAQGPTLASVKPSTPKGRIIKKAASKHHRGMTSPRPDVPSASNHSLQMDSIATDLEKILSEIDIPSDELESLIENFDEDEGEAQSGAAIFDGIETFEGNLAGALSQLQLNSWQSSDSKLSEKYHDERLKREHCEKELRALQETLLAEKQQNAVLEGTLKRRNVMLMQITVAFNRVCKEWKKFDAENKAAVSKLQHDQKILAAACKQSRERISQYETELHKTLEMADSFKSKLNDVQNERDESIMLLKETNNELEAKIAKLKEDMELLKNERDATLRALREAQIKLDEGKSSLENMESHIKSLEDRDLEYMHKYDELLRINTQLDSNLLEATNRKVELENMVVKLRTELELEKSSKDQLKKAIQEEAERKNKMEAERLHEYYNKKVQEILKAATEEASTAESLLKDQMKRAAIESERRHAECKERYMRELDALKAKYEAEIESLKRENLHKQLLISSTVKQLQLGESTNLAVNTVPVQVPLSRISQNKKDISEVLKSQTSQDSCENTYKNIGVSNLTKFTIEHLPSIVPLQHQAGGVGGTTKDNSNGQQRDLPFEVGKAFVRYKTSTPIDALTDAKAEVSASGDFRRSKSVGNQAMYYAENSKQGTEKVCSAKLVNSGGTSDFTDFKNVLSHFLEAPVKPEKELQMSNLFSNGKSLEAGVVDPALQKCIQELLKSYSDKVNSDSKRNGSSSATSIASVHVGVGNNNDDVNKNENECSNDNSDSERNQQSSSTSESLTGQFTSRSDSRKSKTKVDSTNIQEPSLSQMKPPWK